VLLVGEGTAGLYAEVRDELNRSGRPIPANDLWLAALARQHGLLLWCAVENAPWGGQTVPAAAFSGGQAG